MTWYGMIAHKPDGADYCRGCLMDSWSGEFETCLTEDIDELMSNYAPLALRKYEDREPRFEFTFLIDGRPIYPSWTPDDEDEQEMFLRRKMAEAADDEVERIKQRKIEEAARKKEEDRLRAIREAEEREREERATLARLQSKYGVSK